MTDKVSVLLLSAYASVTSDVCRFSSMWLSSMWNHLVTWSQIKYANLSQVMLVLARWMRAE